jgi:hypothetical protein
MGKAWPAYEIQIKIKLLNRNECSAEHIGLNKKITDL